MKLTNEQIDLLKKLMTVSAKKGNLPNSGIVLEEDKIIASAESWVLSSCDATAHSERMLVQTVGSLRHSNYTPGLKMVSVIESCLMCLSACSQAGYDEVYYIIPTVRYKNSNPWISDIYTMDKAEIAKNLTHPVKFIHLNEYEEEFCKIYEEAYKDHIK